MIVDDELAIGLEFEVEEELGDEREFVDFHRERTVEKVLEVEAKDARVG